jgi:hypothetical protein
MDEGTFVTFGDSPYIPISSRLSYDPSSSNPDSFAITTTRNSSSSSSSSSIGSGSSSKKRTQQSPWTLFKLGHNHLDFQGFGDVAGIIQYPNPIIRPGGPDEESLDLRSPHTFSTCVRPVILYFNFLYMFGDWWLRSMPTFMHALATGAWDRRVNVIVATGGQKLEPWQKLVLQTLTDHPVFTLSTASSRALAVQHAAAEEHSTPQHAAAEEHSTPQHAPAAGAASPSDVDAAAAADSVSQQQQQQQQQQRNLQQLESHGHAAVGQGTAAAAAAFRGIPVTSYGRCFELLTICSIHDARHFPLLTSQQ